jgi:hypothetical protein
MDISSVMFLIVRKGFSTNYGNLLCLQVTQVPVGYGYTSSSVKSPCLPPAS